MDYIYNSPSIQIIRNKDNYVIKSTYNNFFKEMLNTLNVQLDDNAISTEINIKLDSIISLSDYLNNKPDKLLEIFDVTFIIQDVIDQIKYLEANNKTISYFSIDDFFILNNNSCLFIGVDKIYSFNDSGNFKIQEIITKKNNLFLSPEIVNIKKIPSTINYKACYYSLGLLLLKIFINVDDIKNNDDFVTKSKSIHGLPCYWFIKNLLERNHNDRHILYI